MGHSIRLFLADLVSCNLNLIRFLIAWIRIDVNCQDLCLDLLQLLLSVNIRTHLVAVSMVMLLVLASYISKWIPTSRTLAQVGARNTSLEALTVLFLALTGFALAALKVHVLVLVDLVFESINITLEDVFNSLPPLVHLGRPIVAAALAHTVALRPASLVVSETLTVELEALGIPALASLALISCSLNVLPYGVIHDLISLQSDGLFILMVLLLFLLLSKSLHLQAALSIPGTRWPARHTKLPIVVGRALLLY